MLNRIVEKISGNYNEKKIKSLAPTIEAINQTYESYHALTDEQIKAKTEEFKQRLHKGETLDDLLIEAYAVVKQACKRMIGQSYEVKGQQVTWQMIPYDVQLVGAIVLHQSTIAEMKTGEGKTLVAALPIYLNALEGKGAHVVTVNDYLASRDAQWMGHLYHWLGMSVGIVVKGVSLQHRREQYACDITYVENSELGFDYLRDNLVKTKAERNLLWRPLNYTIIDEIDSILIDEARTPLIISHAAEEATDKYVYYAKLAQTLLPAKGSKKVSKGFLHDRLNDVKNEPVMEEDDQTGDYFIDEKTKTAILSSAGIEKIEKMLNIENLYRDLGYEEIHHIENALKAIGCYRIDKEYIIKDGEVMIVDQNTGRAMSGRRFSQGLHQAIEAKEGVEIKRESKTMATITYQNFFKQYKKLAGMTGTATTEGEEFEKIYELSVLAIPTNKPNIRVDKTDKVYFSQKAKRNHALDYIQFAHQMGQPILIGTSSINTSEYVSKLLREKNIIHSVLNAKFHEQEAKIITNAGKQSSVVVATNMAGRGTDIKLDPELNPTIAQNYATWIKQTLKSKKTQQITARLFSSKEFELMIDSLQKECHWTEDQIINSYKTRQSDDELKLSRNIKLNTNKNRDNHQVFAEIMLKDTSLTDGESIEKDFHFGLMILATEKHDSRRIDNQLRGRAGRQGDPGVSVFMVALDDDIMKKVGGEKIRGMASMLLSKQELDEMELTQKQFTRSIQRAQKQMEGRHFSIRKHLFDYDSVVDKQRLKIYRKRDMILDAIEVSSSDPKERGDLLPGASNVSPVMKEVVDLIPKVVHTIMSNHMIMDTPFEELEIIVQKEFNSKLTAQELKVLYTDNALTDTIIEHVMAHIQIPQGKIDQHIIDRLFANIYLDIIDKYRVDHIDNMQHLRDKVGLMSYAQQDPLVIYKKEAYEKFTALNLSIQRDTVVSVANLDRDNLQQKMHQAQEHQQRQEALLMKKLKEAKLDEAVKTVSAILGGASITAEFSKYGSQADKKMIFEDEDGVEVIEMNENELADGKVSSNDVALSDNYKNKLRPNDKVTVKYSDGKVVYEVKYKKVKDDLDSGKAVLSD